MGAVTFCHELLFIGVRYKNPLLDQLVAWASGMLFAFTPIAASAIYIATEKPRVKPMYICTVTVITIAILTGILTGVRGRICWVISLIAISSYVYQKPKILKLCVLFLLIIAPAFSYMGSYKNDAATVIVGGGSTRELFDDIFLKRDSVYEISQLSQSGLMNFAERAQGPRNAVALYNAYDKDGGAGWSIYYGSIFFPFPRSLWATKPIPGSPDENENNAAIFKVVSMSHGLPYMGPVMASAHAYWEGGWVAVCVYAIMTGLLWVLILRLSQKLPEGVALLVVASFSASLLIDGFLTMLTPLYTFPLITWKWVLPTLLLFACIKSLLQLRKISSVNQFN